MATAAMSGSFTLAVQASSESESRRNIQSSVKEWDLG